MKQATRATRLVFLAFGMGAATWAPMAPFVKSRLNLDNAQFGLMLSILEIATILALPLTTWLIKRLGSRVVTIISGILMLTLLPILAIASTFFYLGTALLLFSGVSNAMNIAINTQAIAIESQSRQSLMSGFHCSCSIGSLLVTILIGVLLEFKWGLFHCTLLISTIINLIIAFQWKNLLSDESSLNSSKKTKGVIERRVFGLGLLCFFAFMSEGCMLHWSAEFLRSSLQYSISRAGIGYGLFSIAMAGGRLLGDKIISRFGQLITFQMSCFIGASGFIILFTRLWPYAELIGFLLAGLGAANIVPILFSLAGTFRKTTSYYALSIVTFFGYAGSLMGPIWMGFVANAFSLTLAFGCMAAVLFVIGLFGFPLAMKASKENGSNSE